MPPCEERAVLMPAPVSPGVRLAARKPGQGAPTERKQKSVASMRTSVASMQTGARTWERVTSRGRGAGPVARPQGMRG